MSQHLVTTTVKAAICPRCHHLTLTGHTDGIPSRCDPVALTPAGALAAILAGRATYTLTRTGLVHRDASRIGDPRIRGPILAAHKCGQPIPAEHCETTETPTQVKQEGIPY